MGEKALLGSVLQQARPVAVRDGALVVAIAGNPFLKEQLAVPASRELVNQAVEQHVAGARRVEVSADAATESGVQSHPAVRAVLERFQGEIVSVRPDGSSVNKAFSSLSWDGALSHDGRFVAFSSSARLLPGQRPGNFIRDRRTDTTTRIPTRSPLPP